MQKFIIIFSFLSICTFAQAQNTAAVESSFKKGDASLLITDMAQEIELCIGDDVQFLSSKQAVVALNNWFTKVSPESLSGKIVGGSAVKYYNGHLKTAKGSFKLFVYYNEKSGSYKIDEIRIGTKG